MSNCEGCRAIITGSINWMDMFEYWWNNEGIKNVNPKTPTSIIAEYKRIAEISWNASQNMSMRTHEAVIIKSGYPHAF